jgi:hypothetical protein
LALRDDSHVFNLQRQLGEKPGEASKLLLIQSFEEEQNPSRYAEVDHLPALTDIGRPDDAQNVPDVDEIEQWGSLETASNKITSTLCIMTRTTNGHM